MKRKPCYKNNFYLAGYHCIADVLKPSYNHEFHFGCSIANSKSSDGGLYIESVEHAESLIQALRSAIAEVVLLPEAEIRAMRARGINSRRYRDS